MGMTRQRPTTIGVLVTREVRWFSTGPLPADVLAWFVSAPGVSTDHRIDHYDLTAARDGIGRKHRNGTLLDVKSPLDEASPAVLAPGMTGLLEDWIKVSRPIDDVAESTLSEPVAVDKRLHTRRFDLIGLPGGCEVELAEIHSGSLAAWSLCFETFGNPEHRERALHRGIEGFLSETPLPTGLAFDRDDSRSYPVWLGELEPSSV